MRTFGKAVIFVNEPVNTRDSGARDYFDIIPKEQARDLGSIKSQLKSSAHFPTPKAFADVSRVPPPHPSLPVGAEPSPPFSLTFLRQGLFSNSVLLGRPLIEVLRRTCGSSSGICSCTMALSGS